MAMKKKNHFCLKWESENMKAKHFMVFFLCGCHGLTPGSNQDSGKLKTVGNGGFKFYFKAEAYEILLFFEMSLWVYT